MRRRVLVTIRPSNIPDSFFFLQHIFFLGYTRKLDSTIQNLFHRLNVPTSWNNQRSYGSPARGILPARTVATSNAPSVRCGTTCAQRLCSVEAARWERGWSREVKEMVPLQQRCGNPSCGDAEFLRQRVACTFYGMANASDTRVSAEGRGRPPRRQRARPAISRRSAMTCATLAGRKHLRRAASAAHTLLGCVACPPAVEAVSRTVAELQSKRSVGNQPVISRPAPSDAQDNG
jgi:hypothetical protein